MNISHKNKRTINTIIALLLILIIIFSKPAGAVIVELGMDNLDGLEVGQSGYFYFNITIGGNEKIPIANFSIEGLPYINGSPDGTLLFNLSDTGTTVGNNVTKGNYVIELIKTYGWTGSDSSGSGYLDNNDTPPYLGNGTEYQFDGYGYGYGYGYANYNQYTQLAYKIYINTTGATAQTYNVIGKVNTGDSNKPDFSTSTTPFQLNSAGGFTQPSVPAGLTNTIGNYWVNYTWIAGTSGGITDSYNVKLNTNWTNGTKTTFINTSVGSGGWANIEVWAYNKTGNGNLSMDCASDRVQAPEIPDITSSTPASPVTDLEGATRTFNISINQTVNVSWLFNGSQVHTDITTDQADYTFTNAKRGVWNVSAVVSNKNGTNMKTWIWNVLPCGSVSVQLKDEITKRPIKRATVLIINESTGETFNAQTTGYKGRYFVLSIAPGNYTINATANKYLWNNKTSVKILAKKMTRSNLVLTPDIVKLDVKSKHGYHKLAVGSAFLGDHVEFDLRAINYGINASFEAINSSTDALVKFNGSTDPFGFSLDHTDDKDFNVTVNSSEPGIYPVIIRVKNGTAKSDFVLTLSVIRNQTGNTIVGGNHKIDKGNGTNVNRSVLENAIVQSGAVIDNSTLKNSTVEKNATVEGNSFIQDSIVKGERTCISGDSVIDPSIVDNSTVDSSTVTDSHLVNSAVTNSVISNITTNGSTINGVTIDSDHNILFTDAKVIADGNGSTMILKNANTKVVIYGITFTGFYADTLLEDLVIKQTDNKRFNKSQLQSMDASDMLKCYLTVNFTQNALLNITETGINPDGKGTGEIANSQMISNFLYIQHNVSDAAVQNATLRIYYDASSLTYDDVFIYHYNKSAKTWVKCTSIDSGKFAAMDWVEIEPGHFSSFILTGITAPGDSGSSRRSGGSTISSNIFTKSTPTEISTPKSTAKPLQTEELTGVGSQPETGSTDDTLISDDVEDEGGMSGWLILLLFVGIAGIIAIIFVVMRKKKEDEEESGQIME